MTLFGAPSLDPALSKAVDYLLPLSFGALLKSLFDKKFRSADASAVLALQRDVADDASRDQFRAELMGHIERQDVRIGALQSAHEKCERDRETDNAKCAETLQLSRERMDFLSSRIDFYQSLMKNQGDRRHAPHVKAKQAKRTKAQRE